MCSWCCEGDSIEAALMPVNKLHIHYVIIVT